MRLILTAALLCLLTIGWSQQPVSTIGKDFWFSFAEAGTEPGIGTQELTVFVSSASATSGTIEIPLIGYSANFVCTPGVTTSLNLEILEAECQLSNVVENKGVHVVTDDPVSVYVINYDDYQSDGTRILPTKFLGTEYICMAYRGFDEGFYEYDSEMVVVATEDDSEMEITFSCDIKDGPDAGQTLIISLNAGEAIQFKGRDFADDLTGSHVIGTEANGDCRPFAVFGASGCTNVPFECGACDHVFDQNTPVVLWKEEFLMPPLLNITDYTYKVIARDDNTEVFVDGVSTYTLDAGEAVEANYISGDHYINATGPIYVGQFLQGGLCAGTGDGALMSLNSIDQTLLDITVSTVVSAVINSHALNVIVPTDATGTVTLDGAAVPPGDFTPFTAFPSHSYAMISIAEGSHSLSCPDGFIAYSYGSGGFEAYAYSAGASGILDEEDNIYTDSYCTLDTVLLATELDYFDPYWTTQSNPDVVIGTGNTYLLVPPILNEVYIIQGNSLVSGCEQIEYFAVSAPEPITVDAGVSNIDLCFLQPYELEVSVDPPSDSYIISWENAGAFLEPNQASTTIQPYESGWYYVTAATPTECVIATDSFYVEVQPGSNITTFSAFADPLLICQGDQINLTSEITQVIAFEPFANDIDPTVWIDVQGEELTDICGSISGNALYFNGTANRWAETIDYDLTEGGEMSYYIKISDGSDGCDPCEAGEGVLLQYSTNGGGIWTDWVNMPAGLYDTFIQLTQEVPAPAQTAATRFRWIQNNFSGIGEDVWMLENIALNVTSNDGISLTWTSDQPVDDPTAFETTSTPAASTDYVIQTNQGTCFYTDTVSVEVITAGSIQIVGDSVLCPGEISNLSIVIPDGSAEWSTSELGNSINVDDAGIYTVTVTTTTGCEITDTHEVVDEAPPAVAIVLLSGICGDESGEVSIVTDADNWEWENGATTASTDVDAAGNFGVTAYSQNGCVSTDDIMVDAVVFPPAFSLPDLISCDGVNVAVPTDYAGPLDFEWSTGSTNDTLYINQPGNYSLTLYELGCTNSYPFTLASYPSPEVYFSQPGEYCDLYYEDGYPVTAYANAPLVWEIDGSTDSTLVVFAEGVFNITLTSPQGCVTEDNVAVVSDCPPIIYVPTAFTPNSDEFNPVFKVVVSGELDSYEIKIFDRWGQVVFASTDPEDVWLGNAMNNGTFYVPNDVYPYQIDFKATRESGEIIVERLTGTVTVIR